MKIAIVSNSKIENSEEVIGEIAGSVSAAGLNYDILDINSLKDGYDFVCAIGGDGTILKTSRFYSESATPVMGINFGRLGFLSLFNSECIDKIGEIIKNKNYTIRERMLLTSMGNTALNDIVIKGHSSARTSKFNLYINGKLVSDYIADGIIVSTPTGSTAYGLSAGGPILHPGLDVMVIVPICAHTMTARPLVVPAKEKISVKTSDEKLDVIFDGQITVKELHKIDIERAVNKAQLAFPVDYKFYSVLRNKLSWGVSPVSQNEDI